MNCSGGNGKVFRIYSPSHRSTPSGIRKFLDEHRWCWDTSQVSAYISDMKDVKCPKDILKSVFNACDEAVEQLRDETALLDVIFLKNLSIRSWMFLTVMGVLATSTTCSYFFGVSQPESKSFSLTAATASGELLASANNVEYYLKCV